MTPHKLDFGHFYESQVAVFISSLFSAARLFKHQVFNVMFKNSDCENKGPAKSGLSVSEKWPKSSLGPFVIMDKNITSYLR